MTWLTHAELRRDTPQARQLAYQLVNGASENGAHDLIWSLFADKPDARRDFLYSEVGEGGFLVVSQRSPVAEPAIWTVQTRPYAPAVGPGERFGFTLRANPTVSLSLPDRARSRRHDVLMAAKKANGKALTAIERETAAMNWLYDRADGLGVEFDRERCRTGRQFQLKIRRSKGRAPISLTAIDYEGVLTVAEPQRLLTALMEGVGRGKAFGMGLMLLRRLEA